MRPGREHSALDLVEEALHCLRRAPRLLAPYYLGSLPFVLGFLYFWAEMSRSALAPARCAAASLGLALLFVWMKAWQAAFARGVRAFRVGEPSSVGTRRQAAAVVAAQAVVHAAGLLALPAAAVLALPLGWVWAFLQHATAVGRDPVGGLRGTIRRAWAQARRDPGANHALLGLLGLAGLFAFLNLAAALVTVPVLLKALLGLESPFTRSWGAYANTTVLAVLAGLTYLAVDPLAKAAYVLRHFYGESRATGEDLRADLRRLAPSRARASSLPLLLVLAAVCLGPGAVPARGEPEPGRPAARSRLDPEALGRAADRVLAREEYAWRLPRARVEAPDDEPGLLAGFLAEAGRLLEQGLEALRKALGALGRWLRGLFPEGSGEPAASRPAATAWVKPLLAGAFALALAVLVGLLLRRHRLRKRRPAPAPLSPAPDLEDTAVPPDALDPEGWADLARDLAARGQLRLALRALYLAGLALLAEQRLVTVARHKSDREYEAELRRRGPETQALLPAFSENLRLFEGVWYGAHLPSPEVWEAFVANHDRISAHAR
ncbi:MAG: hypothetical protein AB1578_12635 [Thermodesulfobacteriota bacterium]